MTIGDILLLILVTPLLICVAGMVILAVWTFFILIFVAPILLILSALGLQGAVDKISIWTGLDGI